MKRIEAIILSNELPDDHFQWIEACNNQKELINYRVVNLTLNNWLDEIQKLPFNILLAKPGGLTAPFKQLYDERIYLLDKVLRFKIYPSPDEIFIYENKRFLSYWLKCNKIPHPRTDVFYNRKEAEEHLSHYILPFVVKTNIGASGSGVKMLKTTGEVKNYLDQAFSGKGAPKRYGPNTAKGEFFKRGLHYLIHPNEIRRKLNLYNTKKADTQNGFVIFQEYIPHDFEWRVVRIGDSYFAHKKMRVDEKASGSLKKIYDNPPLDLLDFVREITNRQQFLGQAMDIFETKDGYLVNEIQCIFGQSDSFQMLVEGKPGRYRYVNDTWLFEEGEWAKNACYNLRLDYIIQGYKITEGVI